MHDAGSTEAGQATTLLTRVTLGDAHAADALTPMVYDQLKALASSMLAGERAGHTLQATALVHEAYLRLIDQREMDDSNRAAFVGLASTIMRRVLVDHARAKKRVKRGGDAQRVVLSESRIAAPSDTGDGEGVDIEALDAALARLGEMDERKAKLVEMRFFGGVDEKQAAEMLGISRATASREWRMARAWLASELERQADGA